jgi:hypothetical protein
LTLLGFPANSDRQPGGTEISLQGFPERCAKIGGLCFQSFGGADGCLALSLSGIEGVR